MSAGSAAPPTPTRGAAHLHQVDLVRVLTFAAVVGVHSVAFASAPESVGGNALLSLLHFTREGFFALSGFVLVHASRHRRPRPLRFWRRRLPPVAVPYLAWSVLYVGLHALLGTAPLPTPRAFVGIVLAGAAEYHLYFLLVTLQVYLLLPALLTLLRRTRGFHPLLLAGSLAVQAAVATFLQYGTASPAAQSGPVRFFASHAYELVVTYQFWVLLGALAAVHLERLDALVDRYTRPLLLGTVVVLLTGQAGYRAAVGSGTSPSTASSVFQPLLIPSFVATIALLYVLGVRWAAHPSSAAGRPLRRWMARASEASFGIYLVHPAVLELLAHPLGRLSPTAEVTAAWVLAILVSAAFVALVRLTPASFALTGRRWARPVAHTSTPPTAAASLLAVR